MQALEKKTADLPAEPGVYLYKDGRGDIIYVGKAKSLRHRVRSYFQDSRQSDIKLDQLRSEISDLECIVVDNEMEALALENNLIKQHKPKYNILLRDDKTYPCIKLSVNEPFPRISVTRRVKSDGALYFGPFFPASLASRIFQIDESPFPDPYLLHRYRRPPPQGVPRLPHQALHGALRGFGVQPGRICRPGSRPQVVHGGEEARARQEPARQDVESRP